MFLRSNSFFTCPFNNRLKLAKRKSPSPAKSRQAMMSNEYSSSVGAFIAAKIMNTRLPAFLLSQTDHFQGRTVYLAAKQSDDH